MDAWQAPLEDVGPAGVDKGKGGKYLIMPPGYKDKTPADYIPMPSDTYGGYALLRSIPKSGSAADVAKAVAYGKRIKLYPLANASTPPATVFHDVADIVYDSTIPYDIRFFESLDRITGEIANLWVWGLPTSELQREYDATNGVTIEQVAAASKKYVQPGQASLLLVGDRSKIEAKVKALNLGEIVVLDTEGKPVAAAGTK